MTEHRRSDNRRMASSSGCAWSSPLEGRAPSRPPVTASATIRTEHSLHASMFDVCQGYPGFFHELKKFGTKFETKFQVCATSTRETPATSARGLQQNREVSCNRPDYSTLIEVVLNILAAELVFSTESIFQPHFLERRKKTTSGFHGDCHPSVCHSEQETRLAHSPGTM